jgi:gliding motility-associated-like protein
MLKLLELCKLKMNLYFTIRTLLYFMLIALSPVLSGQIFSPEADNSRVTAASYSPPDSIFIFFSTAVQPKLGSLTAIPSEAGIYNFEWSKYNPLLSTFEAVFPIQNNLTQSKVINLEEGGYKVRITNGLGVDVSYTAWVFINELRAEVEKNDQGKIKTGKYTCDFLVLNGKAIADTFQYYDLSTHQPLILPNGYNFLWTSDNPDLIIPNADKILDPNITYRPPYIDTRYYLTVTDSFDMTASDTVLYETIHVKADFSFQVFDKEDSKTYIDPSEPYEAGSPFGIKFTNKSINGARFEWVFADSLRSGFFENELTSDVNYEPEYSYLIPDEYYPAIIATSMEGCVDSFTIEKPIIVLPSLLEVPNVFTPDGDDINRYFKVKHQSIKEFTIIIMNRWGKVVYKADVKDMYDWEGWDGTVLNTNNPASPGAYFYVIEARGYDSKRYYRNQYRGTVYLYRGEY